MLEQGVALPQSQLSGPHRQQAAGVAAIRPVKDGCGGGIVAGIQSQNRHGHSSGSSGPAASSSFFSGLGAESANSARTKEPRIPLIKETTSAGS